MAGWNFADAWEAVAEALPDAPAQIQGERRVDWASYDHRADGVAKTLLEAGLQHQDKVAQYLYNCPEYFESVFAAFKAGLVPVNTNYRYLDDELVYLWDNADAAAVVFHAAFIERIEAIRGRVPKVRLWLWVDDGAGPCPDWAVPYEDAAASATTRTYPSWGRSGDDIYMLYTGGTTGPPKGVMYRQHPLCLEMAKSELSGEAMEPLPDEEDLDALRRRLTGPGSIGLAAPPLMHGTGTGIAFVAAASGGALVTLTSRSFDPIELLEAIPRERVSFVGIVGDAFARPILEALDENPGRWDLSSLRRIVSSGAMWSETSKRDLLRHHPDMTLMDGLSSTEATAMGMSVSTGEQVSATGRFTLGGGARVVNETGKDVVPGSGEIGMFLVREEACLGFYKDPDKTARTFRIVDGERYATPGDMATVERDGTVRMLGRGAFCINTGGEKVFPDEVEEILKEHVTVRDAAIVGFPDERFGEVVTALVETNPNASVDEKTLIAYVKERLAGYKAPRRIIFVPLIERNPNGKLDYAANREKAIATLTASSPTPAG